MLVNDNHATIAEDSRAFWEDALKNARINYFQLDKLIYELTNDQKKIYSMDTGQDSVNITKQDLPSLIDRKTKLRKEIEELEIKLGYVDNSPRISQGVPGW